MTIFTSRNIDIFKKAITGVPQVELAIQYKITPVRVKQIIVSIRYRLLSLNTDHLQYDFLSKETLLEQHIKTSPIWLDWLRRFEKENF